MIPWLHWFTKTDLGEFKSALQHRVAENFLNGDYYDLVKYLNERYEDTINGTFHDRDWDLPGTETDNALKEIRNHKREHLERIVSFVPSGSLEEARYKAVVSGGTFLKPARIVEVVVYSDHEKADEGNTNVDSVVQDLIVNVLPVLAHEETEFRAEYNEPTIESIYDGPTVSIKDTRGNEYITLHGAGREGELLSRFNLDIHEQPFKELGYKGRDMNKFLRGLATRYNFVGNMSELAELDSFTKKDDMRRSVEMAANLFAHSI